jgi:hypothetical protein
MNVTITTYAELDQWTGAFMRPDGLSLLFMVGNPGTGKSVSFRDKAEEQMHCCISAARLTPLQLYRRLFRERNRAIIFDDVDDALKRPETVRLLMSLCETDEEARSVAWLGTEALLRVRQGRRIIHVPQEFRTTSRVCIICNDWAILTSKFSALLDRGTVVFFDPGAEELHRFVGRWFQDREVYEFIGQHLGEITRPSIRFYVKAADHKRAGLDWKGTLLHSWTNEPVRGNATENLVRRLLADTTFKADKERIEAFVAHPDGGSRRTWFNVKQRLALNGRKRPGA